MGIGEHKFEEVTVEFVGRDEDVRFGEYDKVVLEEDICIQNDALFSTDPERLLVLIVALEDDRTFIYKTIEGKIKKGDKLKIKERDTCIH